MKKNLPIIIAIILTLGMCVTASIGYSTDNRTLKILSGIFDFFWNITILYLWFTAERSKGKQQLDTEILETLSANKNDSSRTENSGG